MDARERFFVRYGGGFAPETVARAEGAWLERRVSMHIVRAGPNANCLRLAPPLVVSEAEIDLAVEIMDASLRASVAAVA